MAARGGKEANRWRCTFRSRARQVARIQRFGGGGEVRRHPMMQKCCMDEPADEKREALCVIPNKRKAT